MITTSTKGEEHMTQEQQQIAPEQVPAPSKKEKNKVSIMTGSRVSPLVVNDLDSLYRLAKVFSMSGMLPKEYQAINEPEQRIARVFTAIQMGAELGLHPMQSIQNIAVINGRPSIWGDAMLALVRASGKLGYFKEYFEGTERDTLDITAVCEVQRIHETDDEKTIERFSVRDAQKAGLWGKQGPWSQHPKRMLKYRARAFALRDKFADVIKGMYMAEELEGEFTRDVTPQGEQKPIPDAFTQFMPQQTPQDATPANEQQETPQPAQAAMI